MRIYDPRIGKFLSVDPLTKEYPWNSPYAFAENDVIRNVDLDGAEKLSYMSQYNYDGSWGMLDRLKAVPNSAGNIYNGVIADTWNSGVEFVSSLSRGTFTQDLKNDLKQLGGALKQTAVSTWDYNTQTPFLKQLENAGSTLVDPRTTEAALTIVLGSKLPVLG